MSSRPYRVLAVCLLGPAAAAVIRKLAPGQPTFMEIGGIGFVLLGAGWMVLRRRILPRWVLVPMLVWAYFQLLYGSFALAVDWRVGAAAVLTRIAPMLMAGIAYAAIRNAEDLRRASLWVGLLAAVLVPVGLLVSMLGNDIMPVFLRPIIALEELERTARKGVPAVSAVFSTQQVMSMSMLAVLFLSLANAAQAEAERRSPRLWWLFAVSALFLVFVSTRRGAFLAAAIGLAAYVLTREKVPARLIVGGTVLVAVAMAMDQFAVQSRAFGKTRGELLMEVFNVSKEIPFRLYDVFGRLVVAWVLDAPFGTYLGFAGPEGGALAGVGRLAGYMTRVFEVGGAQLMAEMGILGALLMPLVVGLLVWQARRRSAGLKCRDAINMLTLYQVLFFALYYLKEESAMTGVSMGQVFFWAVPGIAAALIQREKRERRFWKIVIRREYEQALLEEAGVPE